MDFNPIGRHHPHNKNPAPIQEQGIATRPLFTLSPRSALSAECISRGSTSQFMILQYSIAADLGGCHGSEGDKPLIVLQFSAREAVAVGFGWRLNGDHHHG